MIMSWGNLWADVIVSRGSSEYTKKLFVWGHLGGTLDILIICPGVYFKYTGNFVYCMGTVNNHVFARRYSAQMHMSHLFVSRPIHTGVRNLSGVL